MSSDITCLECGVLISSMSGVVCANFGTKRTPSGVQEGLAWEVLLAAFEGPLPGHVDMGP